MTQPASTGTNTRFSNTLSVASDWPYAAKEYFTTGNKLTGAEGDVSRGIAHWLLDFPKGRTANFPDGCNRAWGFLLSSILNNLPLMPNSWEDLRLTLSAGFDDSVMVAAFIRLEDETSQPLFQLAIEPGFDITLAKRPFYQDPNAQRYSGGRVNMENYDKEGRLADLVFDDDIHTAVMQVLGGYYSPTYRNKPRETFVGTYLTDKGNGFGRLYRPLYTPDKIWTARLDVYPLSDAFKEAHTPLVMDEKEASVFFGHYLFTAPYRVAKELWARIQHHRFTKRKAKLLNQ